MIGSMKWLGISLLLLAPPAAAQADRYPPQSVLLFVASWCAPCHAELARLPSITQAAKPFRVLVVPFDDTQATRSMLEAAPAPQRWHPDRAMRRQLAKAVSVETSGLPFSMVTDRNGRACATARQGIDAAAATAMVARCSK